MSIAFAVWGEPLTPFGLDVHQERQGSLRGLIWGWTAASINALGGLLGEPVRLGLRPFVSIAATIRMALSALPGALGFTRLAQRVWASIQNLASSLLSTQYILICNNQLLPIATILWNALMTSSPNAKDGFGTIWIDAVCINQGSDTDKGDQVKAMHDIYHHSQLVMVWLGREQGHDIQAVKDVAAKLTAAEKENPSFWEDLRTDRTRTQIQGVTIMGWLHVGRFLSREYWKRKWIIQEVIVARHLSVACGRSRLEWDETCKLSRAWHVFAMRVLAGENIPGRGALGILPSPHLLGD